MGREKILGKKVKFGTNLAVFFQESLRRQVLCQQGLATSDELCQNATTILTAEFFHGVSSWQCLVGLVMLIYWNHAKECGFIIVVNLHFGCLFLSL